VRVGYDGQSNVTTGILLLAFGVGLIGLGVSGRDTVGDIFAIAGMIELAAGVYYLGRRGAPART
jgi:hypothetical protein